MDTQDTPTATTQRKPGTDRRKRPTPFFNRYFLRGRRRAPRRAEEDGPGYVDRPRPRAIIRTCILIVLSIADIILTDYEIRMGFAEEANPVMLSLLLALGSHTAWLLKAVVTICGAWFLLAHARWRTGSKGLILLNIYYAWIVMIHVVLLSSM